ncbi:hypothetical protein LCGC14_1483660 [marine sediment metagenome]|uniref:Uncharacterized protein n=1 Tax=marine sediment metagenome TaxID=412755 RepID=A0A0F9JUN3_9ZZZZ
MIFENKRQINELHLEIKKKFVVLKQLRKSKENSESLKD